MPTPDAAAPDAALLLALPDLLRPLAERGALIGFRRRQLLIKEGETGDTLYIILAGRVRAFSRGERDREITYGEYGAGEYVGEMSLDGGPRTASVEALEPTRCAMVTRRTLSAYIAERPEFAFELLAKVIRRARAATLSAKQLALNDVYGRLRLLLEAQPLPPGTTLRELGHRVGATRWMVGRLMKDLAQGGYVRDDAQGIAVLRPLPARW